MTIQRLQQQREKIKNELSLGRIYEYEENIEVLITNSKPEIEDS
jgi:hypothetical protein